MRTSVKAGADVIEGAGRCSGGSGHQAARSIVGSSHHRTVYTLTGEPEPLQEAVLRLFEAALQRIDLRSHQGHPPSSVRRCRALRSAPEHHDGRVRGGLAPHRSVCSDAISRAVYLYGSRIDAGAKTPRRYPARRPRRSRRENARQRMASRFRRGAAAPDCRRHSHRCPAILVACVNLSRAIGSTSPGASPRRSGRAAAASANVQAMIVSTTAVLPRCRRTSPTTAVRRWSRYSMPSPGKPPPMVSRSSRARLWGWYRPMPCRRIRSGV